MPMEYDPLLAKLVVWAPTREAATARMLRALAECHIGGIKNNVGIFPRHPARSGVCGRGDSHRFHRGISWPGVRPYRQRPDSELAHILAAIAESRKTKTAATSVAAESGSEWLREGRSRLLR